MGVWPVASHCSPELPATPRGDERTGVGLSRAGSEPAVRLQLALGLWRPSQMTWAFGHAGKWSQSNS